MFELARPTCGHIKRYNQNQQMKTYKDEHMNSFESSLFERCWWYFLDGGILYMFILL